MSDLPIQGDPELAATVRNLGLRPDHSRVLDTDFLATAMNSHHPQLASGHRRIVDLSCGHKAVTAARLRVDCPRCDQMLRHGLDLDGYLSGNVRDELVWPEDPCRFANERTDPSGRTTDHQEERR